MMALYLNLSDSHGTLRSDECLQLITAESNRVVNFKVGKQLEEWMKAWIDGWKDDGWMDGWKEGW